VEADSGKEADEMTALNFKAQFAPLVESGQKRQTIRRAGRSKPPTVGEELQLYTGQRTKQCRLLGTGICIHVQPCVIKPEAKKVLFSGEYSWDWREAQSNEIYYLAHADGFVSTKDFFNFFAESNREHGVDKFVGNIIKWELQK
jgi:hypothetical protein